MRFNKGIYLKQPTNIEIGEGVVSLPSSSRSCPCFRCIWPFCPKDLTRLDRARHNRCLIGKTWSCYVRFPVEMNFSLMFMYYSFCRWQMFFVLMSLSFSKHMCICFVSISFPPSSLRFPLSCVAKVTKADYPLAKASGYPEAMSGSHVNLRQPCFCFFPIWLMVILKT